MVNIYVFCFVLRNAHDLRFYILFAAFVCPLKANNTMEDYFVMLHINY